MRGLILILGVLLFSSCEISRGDTISLTILSDRTDPSIEVPAMEHIRPLLGLDNNQNRGIYLSYQIVGDVDFTPVQSLRLEPYSLLDNDFQRIADVEVFLKEVDTLLMQNNQSDYSFGSSSILRPVLVQLSKAKSSDATQKIVLLYSDLEEISDVFDVLDGTTRRQLLEHPQKLAEALMFKIEVPDLEGVHLHIINYPKTRTKNRMFRALLEMYTALFKGSGLEIHLGYDPQSNNQL